MSTPNPAPSGPPLRALAMVLIALAILFAGLGALSWSSDSKPESAAAATNEASTTTMRAAAVPATATATATTTTATNTTASTTSASMSDVAGSVSVRVLNNSTVAGLAAEMAARLRSDGWTVSETGNYSDENIPQTTVYYGDSPSAKQAATMIADEIGATAAPRLPGLANSTDGVVVILTSR